MRAQLLTETLSLAENPEPLTFARVPDPKPGPGQILIAVDACGVCHTELDEIEGRTPPPELPVIPGHQVVGRVVARGAGVTRHEIGDRVGVGWIYDACGECAYCRSGQENLCPDFVATGRDVDGGYAELMVANQGYAYPIPAVFGDAEAAPLLCAGAIGYRSLRLCRLEDGQNLDLTGFGSSGHLVIQIAQHMYPHSDIYVFARNPQQRAQAEELGAVWAGETAATAPAALHAIIDTTPAWKPVVEALRNLAPGGRLVINAIRKQTGDKEELLRLDYATHLWLEKELKSVANITSEDIAEFLPLAEEAGLHPEVTTYPLAKANAALTEDVGRGSKVLVLEED